MKNIEEKTKTIVAKVSAKFQKYFLKRGMPQCFVCIEGYAKPPPVFDNTVHSCMYLTFETRKEYSRSVNLFVFEDIMESFKTALEKAFAKAKLPWKFWACASCDMQWADR